MFLNFSPISILLNRMAILSAAVPPTPPTGSLFRRAPTPYENHWKSLKIEGNQRKSQGIKENRRKSEKIEGTQAVTNGNPLKNFEFPSKIFDFLLICRKSEKNGRFSKNFADF